MKRYSHLLLFQLIIFSTCFINIARAQVSVSGIIKGEEVGITVRIKEGWWIYQGNQTVDSINLIARGVPVMFSCANEPFERMDNAFGERVKVFTNGMVLRIPAEIASPKMYLRFFAGNGEQFISMNLPFTIPGMTTTATKTRVRIEGMQLAAGTTPTGPDSSKSAVSIFFLGFLGGLLALLTPCVFPMIPVTISFFASRSLHRRHSIRKGIIYCASIFLLYVSASLPFHLFTLKAELLNNISTNPWLNIGFFIIFLFFALSLFGLFTLRLPGFVANQTDKRSHAGSLAGIFFLAFTLVIVSFSCTGPILGSLLAGSVGGGAWLLTAGCAGFGIALGLPFALLAIFPGWLTRLPKSGPWLERLKVSLAFIELALAFKFLSNADLVMQWGLFKREIILGVWTIITVMWIGYLIQLPFWFGGVKIPFRLLSGRALMTVFLLLFTGYLIAGITGKSTPLLSGFAPPAFYSVLAPTSEKLEAHVINNYDSALLIARSQHKKLLIDFTGWACVNCRKMEEQVWTNHQVSAFIRDNYILVSLYVDDKQPLPDMRKVYDYIGRSGEKKDILTYGDLHAAMQVENLGQASQPLYAVVNEKEELQNVPVGYTPDADIFLEWLRKGNKQTMP